MSRARRLAALILLAVAMLTLAIVVLVLNRDVSADLLAALGIIGGVAIAVVALPVNGKNGKE